MDRTTENSAPDVSQLLLSALANRWKNYLAELERCRTEFSNEAVHDLRVATRRMLALIRLLNTLSPRPRFRKLIRAFKGQLDQFDDLRDTQVILAALSETLQEFPQLQEFQKHQQAMEEKTLNTLHKKIKKFGNSKMAKRIRKTQKAIEAGRNEDRKAQVLQAVDDAYGRTRQRLDRVDPARPATIHRVRIAFKSFRYMVEIICSLVPDFPETNFKRMDRYQTWMGEVQDAEVLIQTLADFLKTASFPDPEPVRRYYERRHREAISAYLNVMDQLDTFWRPTPDQPFPWEK